MSKETAISILNKNDLKYEIIEEDDKIISQSESKGTGISKIKKVILKVSHHINEENMNKSKINEDDE